MRNEHVVLFNCHFLDNMTIVDKNIDGLSIYEAFQFNYTKNYFNT